MKEFIILNRVDMMALRNDKPVTLYIGKKLYTICTDDYFKKQIKESSESEESK